MNAKRIVLITVVALVVVGAALGVYYYYTQLHQPVDETLPRSSEED